MNNSESKYIYMNHTMFNIHSFCYSQVCTCGVLMKENLKIKLKKQTSKLKTAFVSSLWLVLFKKG